MLACTCRFGVDEKSSLRQKKQGQANDGERWIDRSERVCPFPRIDQAPSLCQRYAGGTGMNPMRCIAIGCISSLLPIKRFLSPIWKSNRLPNPTQSEGEGVAVARRPMTNAADPSSQVPPTLDQRSSPLLLSDRPTIHISPRGRERWIALPQQSYAALVWWWSLLEGWLERVAQSQIDHAVLLFSAPEDWNRRFFDRRI